MPDARTGRSDHRAVEMFERLARVAKSNNRTVDQCERLIAAFVTADAARRWWERRGYAMPPDDATQQPGADIPATN